MSTWTGAPTQREPGRAVKPGMTVRLIDPNYRSEHTGEFVSGGPFGAEWAHERVYGTYEIREGGLRYRSEGYLEIVR